ncbi:TetR/AcrR family transcriptional regulator [Kitasatospora acidiphila]|uniref:TetR/AcrR family transcriptional regulator n=1 Tax=Kitasatospora acidiphila TaxID=2567942 RepID=UPI003C794920
MSPRNPRNEARPGGADERPVSLWERVARPAPTARVALTPERIAVTAVAVADAEGLDAITMRRLAAELGVAPMAAYRYVSGKGELLDLMVDLVHGELELPEVELGWREALRLLALRNRELLLAHPWLVRIAGGEGALALTPNRLAIAERGLAVLDGLGLDADTALAITRSVATYARGMAGNEILLRELMTEQNWASGEELRSGLAPQMSYLMSTGRYPLYNRSLLTQRRKDDALWQFELGLELLLDGVEARMAGGGVQGGGVQGGGDAEGR